MAVNTCAFPGEMPPLMMGLGADGPDRATAVKMARQFATNVHPDAVAKAGR